MNCLLSLSYCILYIFKPLCFTANPEAILQAAGTDLLTTSHFLPSRAGYTKQASYPVCGLEERMRLSYEDNDLQITQPPRMHLKTRGSGDLERQGRFGSEIIVRLNHRAVSCRKVM